MNLTIDNSRGQRVSAEEMFGMGDEEEGTSRAERLPRPCHVSSFLIAAILQRWIRSRSYARREYGQMEIEGMRSQAEL